MKQNTKYFIERMCWTVKIWCAWIFDFISILMFDATIESYHNSIELLLFSFYSAIMLLHCFISSIFAFDPYRNVKWISYCNFMRIVYCLKCVKRMLRNTDSKMIVILQLIECILLKTLSEIMTVNDQIHIDVFIGWF